jgi:hypothetical protein
MDEHRFVLVLEEVGATIGSIHNPLMSLHGLIDRSNSIEWYKRHGANSQKYDSWNAAFQRRTS